MIEIIVVGVVSPGHGSQLLFCSKAHVSFCLEGENPKIQELVVWGWGFHSLVSQNLGNQLWLLYSQPMKVLIVFLNTCIFPTIFEKLSNSRSAKLERFVAPETLSTDENITFMCSEGYLL